MCYYIIVPREQRKKLIGVCRRKAAGKEGFTMTIKFCTKCGKQFYAIGREVICPDCKEQAAEDAKRAAVLKAKRASWAGESVPVRISGRASTLIRKYAAANGMAFAESLDDLLKSTVFFEKLGTEWNTIQPYKSHRRDRATSTTEGMQEVKTAAGKPQEAPQGKQDEPAKPVKTAAKKAIKTTSKTAGKKVKA